jgi:heptaprenyl diphosphate synthase
MRPEQNVHKNRRKGGERIRFGNEIEQNGAAAGSDTRRFLRERRNVYLALFISAAVVINVVEFIIPLPIPWLKFGFANIFVLLAIFFFGFLDALTVTILRVLISSIMVGKFLTPAFFLAMSGGIVSTVAMFAFHTIFKKRCSLIGVSVIGSYTHAITQLVTAYFLFVKHTGIFSILFVFLIISLITGIINGMAANYLSRILQTVVEEGT